MEENMDIFSFIIGGALFLILLFISWFLSKLNGRD